MPGQVARIDRWHRPLITDTVGLRTKLTASANPSVAWGDIVGKPATFPPDAEAIDDRVGGLLVAGANITLTYDDPGNRLTIASTGSGGGGTATYIGDTPPASPTAGQLFWESDSGNLFIYYSDGTSSQWVPATIGSPGPPGATGPAGPPGPGGEPILSDSGPPADSVGVVGDFYVDETGNAMYGPKSDGISYGDPQSAYPPALVPTSGFSHATLEVFSFVKVTKVGQITAVKFWYDNTTTQTSFKVNVWSTAGAGTGTRLGTATLVVPSGLTGWRTATLTTPVDVAALDVVCVSVGFTNAYSRKDGEPFPLTNGGDISATQGGYGVGLDAYPGAGASTAINFYVDAVFREAISLAWPVAVPGWLQITQAAYDALSPPNPNTLYVVVG